MYVWKEPLRTSAVVLNALTDVFLTCTQCLNLCLGTLPGSGQLFHPNSFEIIFHLSPIIQRSVVFGNKASLNIPQKYKRNSNVCSLSVSLLYDTAV
jgi:hypothetical protein